jgi:hypothetical protein
VVDGVFYSDLVPTSGYHTIRYEYMTPYGCADFAEDSIIIRTSLAVSINAPTNNVFCNDSEPITISGIPIGGEFRVDGQVVTKIKPTELSIGNHELRYIVVGTDGCFHYESYTFEVRECIVSDGLDEMISYLKIYPNPVRDFTNIEINSSESMNTFLKVHNSLGQEIYSRSLEINSGSNQYVLHTGYWASGLYFLQIGDSGKVFKINKL